MSKIMVSLILALGLGACDDDVDDDGPVAVNNEALVFLDPAPVFFDPPEPLVIRVPGVVGNLTCGGLPRRKADATCLP